MTAGVTIETKQREFPDIKSEGEFEERESL